MTEKELLQLKRVSAERYRADGTSYQSLSWQAQNELVAGTGRSPRDIQVSALENGIVPEIYIRNQKSLSNSDQIRLLRTRVAVIGLGGLGGAVTEILARIGIGSLILTDGDSFEESNLNRQLLSSIDNLGKSKAEAAGARVAAINPAVQTRVVTEFLSSENSRDILGGAGIAVDCLDSITSRFVLEQACRNSGIPMVSAAIGGTSGQATVVYPGDPGLSLIYGDPDKASSKGIESVLGTLPFAAITMAAIECAEVVSIAIGKEAPLRNRLFITDLMDHSAELMNFS